MHRAGTSGGAAYLEVYFTTYDGDRYGIPLYDDYGSYIAFSQEVMKIGSLYWTDYFLIEDGFLDDYGEISLNLGTVDTDQNGIDDICEVAKAYSNSSITGNWYSADGTSGSITGSVLRNTGSHEGTYTIYAHATDVGTLTFSDNFYAGTISGTITYSKDSHTFTVAYTSTWDTQSPFEPLETTYEILDQDRIKVHANDFFPNTVFVRSGNTYSAVVTLTDGGFVTTWPDYQKWHIVFEDSNDVDGDGIPDMSDTKYDSHAMPWIPLLLLED
jgi:hypothetical protein